MKQAKRLNGFEPHDTVRMQTLHDRIAETIVISERKRKADPPRHAVPASGR